MTSRYRLAACATLLGWACNGPACATNGMNLEGYGVIAAGMGGASMAYYNGNAGMINNPATLGFLPDGEARLALFAGGLMPTVSANGQASVADPYVMPAVGYIRKAGRLTYGIGMMAQGGMGTEYENGDFWGALNPSNAGTVDMAGGNSRRNMSEVGVGRVILPLAYAATDQLTLGGSTTFGTLSGSMIDRFTGMMGPGGIQAVGTGWAANLGFTYKLGPTLSVGGVYHAKTRIGDMETADGKATASFNVDYGGVSTTIPVAGKVSVHDFQWPET